jgi:RNA polymerase sigma-70 factor (ECF subfamily)
MMGDEHLIRAVAAGNHRALRELFDRHAPWVASRLRRSMPAYAVEDTLQETFIAVWKGARVYRAGVRRIGQNRLYIDKTRSERCQWIGNG